MATVAAPYYLISGALGITLVDVDAVPLLLKYPSHFKETLL